MVRAAMLRAGLLFACCVLLLIPRVSSSSSVRSKRDERRVSRGAVDSPAKEVLITTTEATMDDGLDIRVLLKDILKDVSRKVLPYVQDLAYDQNLPIQCISSFLKVAAGLQGNKLWAMKFLDSAGRPPAGMLEGSTGALGAYDECVGISVPTSDGTKEDFRGQYCTLFLKPALTDERLKGIAKAVTGSPLLQPRVRNLTEFSKFYSHTLVMGLRIGVCLPSKCSGEDLKYIVDKFLKKLDVATRVTACSVKRPVSFSKVQLAMICLLSFLGLHLALSTSVDLYLRYRGPADAEGQERRPFVLRLLLAFSVIRNTEILLKKASDKNSDAYQLRCIHGMRVISYLWITLGHNYMIMDPHIMTRGLGALEFLDEFAFTIVLNGVMAVETFFVMSGFLVGHGVLVEAKKKSSLICLLPVAIIRRYIRLTVPAIFLIGLAFVFPLLVSGPLADDLLNYQVNDVCRRNWWTILAHSSNFRNAVDMCIPSLWYIACEYQIFLGVILFVFLLARKPVLGVISLVAIGLAACIAVGAQVFINSFEPLPYAHTTDLQKTLLGHEKIYIKPVGHSTAFVVGVLAAYCFHKYRDVKFGKWTHILGWSVSVAAGLTVVYVIFDWNHKGSYSLAWTSVYAATHRLAWALALAWVIFVCSTGQAGTHRGAFLSDF
ncbi:nose resistant to fluoxetine protein 6 [Ixodes scapularis]